MNTNQIAKNKGLNLSVTAKGQKSTANIDFPGSNAGQSRARNGKDNTLAKLPTCSGGVCTVTWKPNHNVA